MAEAAEAAAMLRAVELAARGLTTTLPNPVVGCVLLDASGEPVGEGWHERPGEPHAEIVALVVAGERARGSTAVVSLEPCAHTGRTEPCADALIAAGVTRVVVGVRDPWPPAAGGADRLREGGVDVELGVEEAAAEAVNRVWLTAVRRGRPYVTWKLATTLDGRVAAADGSSRWITGPEARADAHGLRAHCDTILVGVGTVLADDPQLTVRSADGGAVQRQPLRVVADTHARTPERARVRDGQADTWVATSAGVGTGPDGRLDLRRLLRELYERDRRHVLLEGGPQLAAAMVEAGLVDSVVAYVAPALLGAGPAALGSVGVTSLADVLRLDLVDVRRLGPDVRIEAHLPPPKNRGPLGR